MISKINLKARIKRHSRILKDNLGNIHPFRSLYHRINYNIVLFFIIFLFPIYPLFSSFFYENSTYDFYRGYIDESSILDFYSQDDGDLEDISLISNDSFLFVNTFVGGNRDISGYNEIINYKVKAGDSLYSIANKFGISSNSILWANNFNSKTILYPNQIIKIPPVSGIIHKVGSGDTIGTLSNKYKISEEKILSQNGLLSTDKIIEGQILIIPGAIKEEPQKPKIIIAKKSKKSNNTLQGGYDFTSGGNSEFVDYNSDFKFIKRKAQWTFYWGNCTWYVAQYKNVNWSGNAKEWLKNAKSKGHSTGNKPSIGAIVVFNGRGYNPYYGHVGIVIGIKGDNIIVKDMNYRKLNEITVRKVPINDRAIKGYIYVD